MRAFSATATITKATSAMASDTRNPTSGPCMYAATEDSWVEPARSETVKTIISSAGSASEAIIISRLEPIPPKLVPNVESRQGQHEARAAQERDDCDQVRRRAESKTGGERRHQRRCNPRRGEDEVRSGTKDPGRVVRQHNLLAQQLVQIAIGLDEIGALATQQARLDLAHVSGEERRKQQDQQQLAELNEHVENHCHTASITKSATNAPEHQRQVAADRQELHPVHERRR